jgi:hypothetical protein
MSNDMFLMIQLMALRLASPTAFAALGRFVEALR